MSIRVRVVGDLRRFVETDPVELDGGGRALDTVLEELGRVHPRLGRELFDAQGRLHYAVVITIDGRRTMWPDGRDTLVEDGGELMLTRFHTGG